MVRERRSEHLALDVSLADFRLDGLSSLKRQLYGRANFDLLRRHILLSP
ncbi:hypothetical protein OG866_01480 [Streptomyces sp. NBC_00663]|nr:hypothetical protein [Streptomyces sp. NBC_00663]